MDLLDFLLVLILIVGLGEIPWPVALVLIALGLTTSWALGLETRPMTDEEKRAYMGDDDERDQK